MAYTGGSSWEPIAAWCSCTEEAIIGLPLGDIQAPVMLGVVNRSKHR